MRYQVCYYDAVLQNKTMNTSTASALHCLAAPTMFRKSPRSELSCILLTMTILDVPGTSHMRA